MFASFSGHVGEYLATKACYGKNNTLLMPESAKGYFSAFKSYLEMKFMDRGVIPVFQRSTWSKFLNTLVTSKQRMHYKKNVALSNPKEMISEQHQEGISKLCI